MERQQVGVSPHEIPIIRLITGKQGGISNKTKICSLCVVIPYEGKPEFHVGILVVADQTFTCARKREW